MLCKIAELLVEVPPAGGMHQRCLPYLFEEGGKPDILIREDMYDPDRMPDVEQEVLFYMESCRIFYWELLRFSGMMLHSAAIEHDGRAYLFSGPSTVGKSTHTRLWKELLGQQVQPINDDKPALRLQDGVWYAYGTPWSGKNDINRNVKVPVAGICFLRQGKENSIRRMSAQEAVAYILSQGCRKCPAEYMAEQLSLIDALVRTVPVFELTNTPTIEAAMLSYQTMRKAAEAAALPEGRNQLEK